MILNLKKICPYVKKHINKELWHLPTTKCNKLIWHKNSICFPDFIETGLFIMNKIDATNRQRQYS